MGLALGLRSIIFEYLANSKTNEKERKIHERIAKIRNHSEFGRYENSKEFKGTFYGYSYYENSLSPNNLLALVYSSPLFPESSRILRTMEKELERRRLLNS